MIAVISAIESDPAGVVELEIDFSASVLGTYQRRVSRVATLDGTAVVNDYGYCDGDRPLSIVTPGSSETLAALQTMIGLYGLVNVSLPDGFYQCGLESVAGKEANITVTLLIKEKLSE